MKDDYDEFDEPYLPARYKEAVRKKKQHRLLKKIGIIAIGIIAVIVVYILVSGMLAGSPSTAPAPVTSPATTATIPPATPAATTAATGTPAATRQTTSIPPTATTTGPVTIVTATPTDTPEPVLTAMAGGIRTIAPSTTPRITETQAEEIARVAFPNLPAGDMSVELVTDPDFGQAWKYTLRADTTVEASGLIDADTGAIATFSRTIHPGGRSQNPALSMGNARSIADSTINSRNNAILSINMSDGRYVPLAAPSGNVAGSYRFVYNRIIQDYPCDVDGFIVSVDSVTGAITEFTQRWQTPDNAYMIVETPVVPRYDATFAVQARAKSIYPASISSLRIISAERVWKDEHAPGTIPRPSTIPLVWKVVFDDETIRAAGAPPAVGWVDTHTGELMEINYQH